MKSDLVTHPVAGRWSLFAALPDIVVSVRAAGSFLTLHKPFMLVTRVVGDEVQHHLHTWTKRKISIPLMMTVSVLSKQ